MRVIHDGSELPRERLRYDGHILRIEDVEGEPLLVLGLFPGGFGAGGQLVYSPDLDPRSVKARYGYDTGELDDEVAEHFGMDPTEGLLVTDVCEGSPAEWAGLRKGDVILETNQTGDRLVLVVLRAGDRLNFSVPARRDLRWPAASEIEAYLSRGLGN